MAEPKAADATVSLTVMHVSACPSPAGLVPEGPAEGDQLWTRMEEGEHRGPENLKLFLEAAWKEAKLEQNLYLRVKMYSWDPRPWDMRESAWGQMSHRPCRSPNSHPQGTGQG